jgi:serine protease
MTILSTVPSEVTSTGSDYGYMQGTSMACPLVSAIAAVGLSYAKKLGKTFTKDEYTAMIETSVDDLDRYCTGTKTYLTGSINLSDYKGRMGTGAIDAWKLMMQIEGTPWNAVQCGTRTSIDLSEYFGGSAANLTYLGVEMDDAYKTSLGLTADPEIENGSLVLTCTKTGCGKVVVKAVAGGTSLGGGDKIGGTEVDKTISIISRGVASENGGWL